MKLSQCQTGLTIALSTLLVSHVAANADKIIFTGPAPANIPLAKPSLSDLNLDVLGPEGWDIRTNLTRVFPAVRDARDTLDDEEEESEADAAEAESGPEGHSSWFLLDNLTEGQRYELRVCWAAIEPTRFALDVYDLDTVFETPALISSLAQYSTARQLEAESASSQTPKVHTRTSRDVAGGERQASVLLLHVHAAADYFTVDKALMASPPPVLVDLILDPYWYNAVPHSLLLTIGYVVLVAVCSFTVSRHVVRLFTKIGLSDTPAAKKIQ